MTIEEIRANKPDVATHYRIDVLTGVIVYIKNYKTKWCDELIDGEWQFVCVFKLFNIKPL